MSDAAGASQDLCVQCGICCGGSLFDHAELDPDEVARTRELGFAVEMQGDQAIFKLPCGFQQGAVCQMYPDRPRTCRAYTCETLRALDARTIDRPEADRRTSEAKTAIARLRTHMLPGESFRELRTRFGAAAAASKELGLALLLHDLALDRYFRRPHQRTFNPVPKVAGAAVQSASPAADRAA